MALLNSMSTRGKITLAACALAFLAAAMMIVKMAGAPSYTTVMTGVDPAKTSQISAALTAAGVSYELQNGGTAVAVQKGEETQANVALASKGLNSGATQPGFEILDQQKLGASSQQQQIAYQRGLEGAIANTISDIQGAEGAQVHLTLPQDNLFADASRGATAAVLIPSDASMMDPGAVRGIANLVASSVPGLKPSAVTITDGTGSMLWPSGDGSTDTGGLPSKTAAEARYDAEAAAKINAQLLPIFGPGKVMAQVNADLNVDKVDQQQLVYGTKGVALTQNKQTEALKGQGAGAAGPAGAGSNLPAYAQNGAAGSGNSNYKNTSNDQTFGVDKTVTRTTKAPGSVNRLDVGIMLDSSVKMTPAQTSQLQKVLQSTVGFQKSRGDTLNVASLPFAKVPVAPTKSGPIPPAFAGILKGAGLGLGALIFLFFVSRHLKKREREELADAPSWLRQLEAAAPQPMMAMPQMAMAGGGPGSATEVMPAVATEDPRRQQLDTIIQQEPERVAAHLRHWITEDNK